MIGRPHGSKNKSGMRADLTCQVRGYSSIDAMIDAAEISLQKFIEQSQLEQSHNISLMESKAHEYLKLYVKIACELASFIHPKRKAIEHIQTDPLKDMNPFQRLEAMKHAVAMLEAQVKDATKDGSGTP
jgi:hypothetical protein